MDKTQQSNFPIFDPEEKFPWIFHSGDEGYHIYDCDGGDVCTIHDGEKQIVDNIVKSVNCVIPLLEYVKLRSRSGCKVAQYLLKNLEKG